MTMIHLMLHSINFIKVENDLPPKIRNVAMTTFVNLKFSEKYVLCMIKFLFCGLGRGGGGDFLWFYFEYFEL